MKLLAFACIIHWHKQLVKLGRCVVCHCRLLLLLFCLFDILAIAQIMPEVVITQALSLRWKSSCATKFPYRRNKTLDWR